MLLGVTCSSLHLLFDTANQNLAFGLQLTGKSATKDWGQTNQSGSRNVGFLCSQLQEDSGSYINAKKTLSSHLASEQ